MGKQRLCGVLWTALCFSASLSTSVARHTVTNVHLTQTSDPAMTGDFTAQEEALQYPLRSAPAETILRQQHPPASTQLRAPAGSLNIYSEVHNSPPTARETVPLLGLEPQRTPSGTNTQDTRYDMATHSRPPRDKVYTHDMATRDNVYAHHMVTRSRIPRKGAAQDTAPYEDDTYGDNQAHDSAQHDDEYTHDEDSAQHDEDYTHDEDYRRDSAQHDEDYTHDEDYKRDSAQHDEDYTHDEDYKRDSAQHDEDYTHDEDSAQHDEDSAQHEEDSAQHDEDHTLDEDSAHDEDSTHDEGSAQQDEDDTHDETQHDTVTNNIATRHEQSPHTNAPQDNYAHDMATHDESSTQDMAPHNEVIHDPILKPWFLQGQAQLPMLQKATVTARVRPPHPRRMTMAVSWPYAFWPPVMAPAAVASCLPISSCAPYGSPHSAISQTGKTLSDGITSNSPTSDQPKNATQDDTPSDGAPSDDRSSDQLPENTLTKRSLPHPLYTPKTYWQSEYSPSRDILPGYPLPYGPMAEENIQYVPLDSIAPESSLQGDVPSGYNMQQYTPMQFFPQRFIQ